MTDEATTALDCRGLVHVYRSDGTDVAALRGIDLTVRPTQRVALLGPSGSGKSTLFTVVAGIMRPSAGTATVFGVDLVRARPAELRRLRRTVLGVMLQGAGRNLLLYDDAVGNLEHAVRGTRRGDLDLGRQVLAAGGVPERSVPTGALSPAHQQVAALAVAMATRPRLLLADEPTSRLDDDARDRLLDVLVDVTDGQGTAVLIVTHDTVVAHRMQRMIHLRDGRIAEEATAAGRYAVIGADGSLQLPDGAADRGWTPGALVSIDMTREREIRITPAE
jgi:putative ABC transport system ATP-binding protein